MRTFTIISLGCKVNQYESQQIRQLIQEYGLESVQPDHKPDLALIHTCCVTHIAASKSRQAIRRALKNNSDCKVIATGCLTSTESNETDNLPSNVICVSRDQDLPEILHNILKQNSGPKAQCPDTPENSNLTSKTAIEHKIKHKNELICSDDPLNLQPLRNYADQTRAFLKIQDGCDGFCTYCIIPKTRKRLWSNSPENVLDEARHLIYAGHSEIVLTGIFLGAYGQETVKHKRWDITKQNQFIELVEKTAQLPGLKRLRLSSLEPGDVTPGLLDVFNKYSNIAPLLHLPLQGGFSRILIRMNRQYDALQYRDMIDMVRDKLDRPAITTDIIVGFPGETDQDFNETLEMANFAQFAKIHVFSYSVRNGTAAQKMDGHINPEIINQRAKILSQLDKKLQSEFRRRFGGETISVIVENENRQTGYCGRYFQIKLAGRRLKRGEFTYAKLRENCQIADIIE